MALQAIYVGYAIFQRKKYAVTVKPTKLLQRKTVFQKCETIKYA
jgi:hypothetical protein